MLSKILLTSIISSVLTFVFITYAFFNSSNIAIGEEINFQTIDGAFTFTAIPSKGSGYLSLEKSFKDYKVENNQTGELILYRTTSKNYLNISRWCAYRGMPECQYPLLN